MVGMVQISNPCPITHCVLPTWIDSDCCRPVEEVWYCCVSAPERFPGIARLFHVIPPSCVSINWLVEVHETLLEPSAAARWLQLPLFHFAQPKLESSISRSTMLADLPSRFVIAFCPVFLTWMIRLLFGIVI